MTRESSTPAERDAETCQNSELEGWDLPPVRIICCGHWLKVAVDNRVECPTCQTIHWIDYGKQEPEGWIEKTEVIPREELEKTSETEYGPTYRCPRCEYDYVTEYCDCPECGWAGMCQEGWE